MCTICKYKYGSNEHLFYWAKYFLLRRDFDKFFRTVYHILNRKAYREWMNEHHKNKHIFLGLELCTNIGPLEAPDEYVDYISSLDATDTLNEYYGL